MLRFSSTLVVLTAAALLAFACDADLESSCRDGTCGGGLNDSGDGGSCNIENTHGLPCEVYQVISENCHECHVPGGIGPFTLTDYDDTQKIYFGDIQIWEQMAVVIQKDNMGFVKMPQGENPDGTKRWPMADSKLAVMNAWFDTCVPDVGCDHVEEEGGAAEGGAGGSGGAGGAGGIGGVGGT